MYLGTTSSISAMRIHQLEVSEEGKELAVLGIYRKSRDAAVKKAS